MELKKIARRVAQRTLLAGWDKLPKGWTEKSVQKFWDSLTGGRQHKVTACMKRMDGKINDPGAFCASLADRVEGKDWRKKAVNRSAAKGRAALEALSDAWDLLDRSWSKLSFEVLIDDLVNAEVDVDDLARDADKLGKASNRLETQTRTWRSALNFMLEGRDIDVPRMTRDVEKTVKTLDNLVKGARGLMKARAYPELWTEVGPQIERIVQTADTLSKVFTKATTLLKAGAY